MCSGYCSAKDREVCKFSFTGFLQLLYTRLLKTFLCSLRTVVRSGQKLLVVELKRFYCLFRQQDRRLRGFEKTKNCRCNYGLGQSCHQTCGFQAWLCKFIKSAGLAIHLSNFVINCRLNSTCKQNFNGQGTTLKVKPAT